MREYKQVCKNGHKRIDSNLTASRGCKKCALISAKSPHSKARMRVYGTDYHLRKTFGISLVEYTYLLVQQNDSCAICKTPQSQLKRALAVDHNHKTNEVRGLLCNLCNSMVLNVVENYRHLVPLATEYLKKF